MYTVRVHLPVLAVGFGIGIQTLH